MERRFHPQIRKLTRLVLEIPPEKPLPDCSWPQSSKTCDLKTPQLIQSDSLFQEESYEVRSVDERRECTLGPEIMGALMNPKDRRTVLERLADLEMSNAPSEYKDRDEFIKGVEKDILGEMSRRSQLIYFYIVYFTIGLLLLTYQNQKTGSFSLTLISVIPLIAIFFLHNMYSERVSQSMFIHLIPVLLLISYGLYSWSLQNTSSVASLGRAVMYLAVIAAIVLSVKLIADFRSVFSNCVSQQLGRPRSSDRNVLLSIFGLILPLTVLLSFYAL